MNSDWVFVGFPMDVGKTHIYMEKDGNFVQRCDTRAARSEGGVCKISEDEMRQLLDDDDKNFCPECLRYLSGLAMA